MQIHARTMIARVAATISAAAMALCLFNCGSEAGPEAANDAFTAAEEQSTELQTSEASEPLAVNQICRWFGTAPICSGACPAGWNEVKRSTCLFESCGAYCVTGSKAYCCQ
jgi:hypothetical protein